MAKRRYRTECVHCYKPIGPIRKDSTLIEAWAHPECAAAYIRRRKRSKSRRKVSRRQKSRWIQRALHKSRRGALHRRLRVAGGKKISMRKLIRERVRALRALRRASSPRTKKAARTRLGQVQFAISRRR